MSSPYIDREMGRFARIDSKPYELNESYDWKMGWLSTLPRPMKAKSYEPTIWGCPSTKWGI